jgi:ubiquinone/menaquinone biosynthesis C-methylase UbiE
VKTKNAYKGTETAKRYDSGRNLPAQTQSLWFEALKSSIPLDQIRKVLDLGCGTGRFTAGLGETFDCPVVGVEPSQAMLQIAMSRNEPNIEWKQGHGELLPVEDEAVDLVFMSQVIHHFAQPEKALREIHRVLTPTGYLAIRNSTRESNKELAWLEFFPAAQDIEDERTPFQAELKRVVGARCFDLVSHRIIHQLFANSYQEYFDKITRRALSSLIVISDEDFQNGVQRFQHWVKSQPRNQAVYEPVDLFIFKKLLTNSPS